MHRLGPGVAQPGLHVLLQLGVHAQAAVAIIEVHPREARVELGAAELLVAHRRGVVLGEKGVDGGVDPRRLGVGVLHHVGHGAHCGAAQG